MEFRLLGPFEARHRGEVVRVASRRKERCLFAILLLEAGRVVPTPRLADLLWDADPPVSARTNIHTYVGRLRRSLAPCGVGISTLHDGYQVEPEKHYLDTHEFEDLVNKAAAATDPVERVTLLDRALTLWRGPLLADIADEQLRQRLDARLSELRLSSSEARAEAQLEMGHHERVVRDLMPMAERYPGREGLVASLMTALYRAGRKADACRIYEGSRRALAEDLGVEPGPRLQALHDRILRGDPGLERPPGPVYAIRVRDQWLPWNTAGHPALEFCNTFAGWGGPRLPGSDWLRSYQTLAVWAGHTDLIDESTVSWLLGRARDSPLDAADVLAEARLLRAKLYSCLTDHGDVAAFSAVAMLAEAAAKESVFTRLGDGGGRWTLSHTAGLRLPVLAAARCAAEILVDPRRHMIRVCPSEECGWLFIDESGLRRWCSMATCGARASHLETLRHFDPNGRLTDG